jgi:hypothetical protein
MPCRLARGSGLWWELRVLGISRHVGQSAFKLHMHWRQCDCSRLGLGTHELALPNDARVSQNVFLQRLRAKRAV